MKNREILHNFICFTLLTLFLGVMFFYVDKGQTSDVHEHTSDGLIKRSSTGHFTRGGNSGLSRSKQNKKRVQSGVIYIGEPTTGLLDF